MEEKLFLTTSEAAKSLNISIATLKKIILQKNIKTFQTPGGHQRVSKKDLLEGVLARNDNKQETLK